MAKKPGVKLNNAPLPGSTTTPETALVEARFYIRVDAFQAFVDSSRANRLSIEDAIGLAIEKLGLALIPPPPKVAAPRGRPPKAHDDENTIPDGGTLHPGPVVTIDPDLWDIFVKQEHSIVMAATKSGYRHVYPHGKKFRFRGNEGGQSAWFGPYDTAEQAAYARATILYQDFIYKRDKILEAFEGMRLPDDPMLTPEQNQRRRDGFDH